MHFLQRMVAKAVSEALTQAMNRKLQKQTDELVQENEDSTGGAYHFLVSGYYRGLQMKIFSIPMIIALLICLAGMTLSGQTDVMLESIMAVLIVVCIILRIVSQKKMKMIAYRQGEILFLDNKDTVIAQMPSYALNEAEINTWKVKIPWDGKFYLIERNPFDNGEAVKEMLRFFKIEEP